MWRRACAAWGLAAVLAAAPVQARDDAAALDGEPEAGESEAGESEAGESEAGESEAGEPEAGESEAGEPAAGVAGASWSPQLYASPLGRIAVYSSGAGVDVGVLAGLEAGLRYAREGGMLQGRTRLAAAGILTSGGLGYDLRGGTFMGVRPKLYGAEIGLDIFQNAYDGRAVSLARSTGVDFPSINVELGPQVFHLLGGITPTWLGETSRQVLWSQTDAFGFGHEFEWRAGLSLNAGLRLSALYYQRTLRAGSSEGLAVGLGFGF